jgi:hypothetical protein
MRCCVALALVWVAVGCGPIVTLDDDEGSGGSSGEGSTSATTVATAGTLSTSTGNPTSGPPPTSTSIASDDASDDVLDEGPIGWDCGAAPPGSQHHCIGVVCDSPMPDVEAWMVVDGWNLVPSDTPYVFSCTIANWTEEGDVLSLDLACADGPHLLEIISSVGIWFDSAGDFVLTVLQAGSTFEGIDQLVTLRRPGGELVLAGAYTPWVPGHEAIPPDFYDPYQVTLLDEVCNVDPPPDGDFLEPCYSVERQALRFSSERYSADVYDHDVDQLGPYVAIVQYAEQRHDLSCTDIPGTWYQWMLVPVIPD